MAKPAPTTVNIDTTDFTCHRYRWLFIVAILFIGILGLLVASASTLVSTDLGTKIALGLVNQHIVGTWEIEDLDLTWSSGQRAEGIRLLAPTGVEAMRIGRLEAPDLSLWSLFRGNRNVGTVQISHAFTRMDETLTALAPTGPIPSTDNRATGDGASGILRGKLEIASSNLSIASTDGSDINIKIESGHIAAMDPCQVTLSMNAEIIQRDRISSSTIDLEIKNLFNSDGNFQLHAIEVDGKGELLDVPVLLIDRLLKKDGLLAELLGEKLDLKVKATGNQNQLNTKVSIHSNNFDVNVQLKGHNGQLAVIKPMTMQLRIDPATWSTLIKRSETFAHTRLVSPVELDGSINKLQIQFTNESVGLAQMAFNAHVSLGDIRIDTGSTHGVLRLIDAQTSIDAQVLGDKVRAVFTGIAEHNTHRLPIELTLTAQHAIHPDHGLNLNGVAISAHAAVTGLPVDHLGELTSDLYGSLCSNTLGANMDTQITAHRHGHNIRFKIANSSAHHQSEFTGTVDATASQLTIHSGQANLAITPDRLENVIKHANRSKSLPDIIQTFSLSAPLHARLGIKGLTAPIRPFKWERIAGTASITLDEIKPVGLLKLKDLSLSQFVVTASTPNLHDRLNLTARTKFAHEDRTGNLQLHTKVIDWTEGGRVIKTDITGNYIPVSLIEQWISEPNQLTWLTGPHIESSSLSFQYAPARHKPLLFNTRIRTASRQMIQLDGHYQNNHGITLDESSHGELEISPQIYTEFANRQDSDSTISTQLKIKEPVTFHVDVKKADIGLTQNNASSQERNWKFNPDQTSFDVTVGLHNTAAFTPKTFRDHDLKVHKLMVQASTTNLRGNMKVDLSGLIDLLDQNTNKIETSLLRSQTNLWNLFDSSGHWNSTGFRAKTNTQLSNTPTAVIDGLLGKDGKVMALLGPIVDIEAKGTFPGNLNLWVKSDTIDLPLPLSIDRNQRITLHNNIRASLSLTEKSTKALLGHLHPIFGDAIASHKPIRLLVKKQPFTIPLKKFRNHLDQLMLDMTLELGTLRMTRKGWLTESIDGVVGVALQLSGSLQQRTAAKNQTYLAHFTPVHMHVEKGRLKISEFWLVSEDLAIGFQGQADLISQQYQSGMGILGASLLTEQPALIEIIDPRNVYDIPMTGKLGERPNITTSDLELAVFGSTAKQQLRRLGKDFQVGFELLGKVFQEDMRRKSNLNWHVPKEGKKLIGKVLK